MASLRPKRRVKKSTARCINCGLSTGPDRVDAGSGRFRHPECTTRARWDWPIVSVRDEVKKRAEEGNWDDEDDMDSRREILRRCQG